MLLDPFPLDARIGSTVFCIYQYYFFEVVCAYSRLISTESQLSVLMFDRCLIASFSNSPDKMPEMLAPITTARFFLGPDEGVPAVLRSPKAQYLSADHCKIHLLAIIRTPATTTSFASMLVLEAKDSTTLPITGAMVRSERLCAFKA